MIYKKQGVLRWSVAAMAILIAFAIGCGNSSVDGILIDPTYTEILEGNSFIQQNKSASRESVLGGSSAERSKASQSDAGTQNSGPILQVSGTPEPTSTSKPPVVEPVSVSADSSPSETGNTTESSVTEALVSIDAEQSSSIISFSLASASDSSSIGHGEPVFISVMIDAGDHDVRARRARSSSASTWPKPPKRAACDWRQRSGFGGLDIRRRIPLENCRQIPSRA